MDHLKSQPQEGKEAGTKTKLGVPTWPVTLTQGSGMIHVMLSISGKATGELLLASTSDWGIFSQSNALLTAALAAPKSQLLDKQSA